MKNIFKKVLCLVLILVSIFSAFSCSKDDGEVTKLSFKSAMSYSNLKKLDGKEVTINGYLATSSPADGSFIFLMNLPYQSCPFCKPNTTELSNTMEIYPKSGKKFSYTSSAVKVVGKLEVAPSENKPFKDRFGYEFNFKIVDATFTEIKTNELGSEFALWNKIAESDIVTDMYSMLDYVNFVCAWPTYFVDNHLAQDGVTVIPGYYLYAADAKIYIEKDGAQWNYGFKEGYFDNLKNKVNNIDSSLTELIEIIDEAKALADKGYKELVDGHYTSKKQFVEKFNQEDFIYTLDNGKELTDEFENIYLKFTEWFSSFEL